VQSAHSKRDHLSCGACHTTATLASLGTADRAFCLQCHTDQAAHKPGEQCAECHLVLTPDQAMRRILAADTARTRRDDAIRSGRGSRDGGEAEVHVSRGGAR
jgi:hypothetical protein